MASELDTSNIAQKWEQKAVEGLVEALRNGNQYVRENAAEALGMIGGITAVDVLIKALLTDTHKDVRWYAAIALGKIGGNKAVEPLKRALSDGQFCVRMAAAEALKRISYIF